MNPLKDGFKTTEFWGLLATLAASAITVGVVLGYVKPQSQESLTSSITQLIAAVGAVAAQLGAYWRYVHGRTEVKKAYLYSMSGLPSEEFEETEDLPSINKPRPSAYLSPRGGSVRGRR